MAANTKQSLLKTSAIGLLPLAILLTNWPTITKLIWFGDELHLLSELDNRGWTAWALAPFAENFMPFFKLLWSGLVFLGNGNYLAILLALWFNHAVNVILLHRILLAFNISTLSRIIALIPFAISPSMIESLGWGMQWSAILATTGFLSGVLSYERIRVAPKLLPLIIFPLMVSALSFSRGVLWCGLLALYPLFREAGESFRSTAAWRSAYSTSLVAASVALVVGIAIASATVGNHNHLSAVFSREYLGVFGYFILGNPLFNLFRAGEPTTALVVMAGCCKWLLVVSAIWAARRNQNLLAVLLWFVIADLGNAALVSLGRMHLDPGFALSSRYQYESLLLFTPFVASLLHILESQAKGHKLVRPTLALTGVLLTVALYKPWPRTIREWVEWRGEPGREVLLGDPIADRDAKNRWIGLPPFMSVEEVRRIQERYNLH